MTEPHFVMSKYLSKKDLYKDKAEYYQKRTKNLEKIIADLMPFLDEDFVMNFIAPDYRKAIQAAKDALNT